MSLSERPILFHYPPSIYSHRVLWYLWLRGIPYDECIQPPVMPRPNLSSIGIGYRKIPILAIGKDIYCDSRLIIRKLEGLFPGSNLALPSTADEGTRRLFENWTIDGGIFANAVKLMPYWLEGGLLQNKAFLDDRQTLMGGRRMTAKGMEAGRPDGLQHLRLAFDMLETTFLADGREWVLSTNEPSIADIDAIWPFEWLIVDRGMHGSLGDEQFGSKRYPKVYAWVERFLNIVKKKREAAPKPTELGGSEMSQRVLHTRLLAETVQFDEKDPLKLKKGDNVEVSPSDYGQKGKTTGSIIGLTAEEVTIKNEQGLHVHFPRWNFSIRRTTLISRITPSIASPQKIPKMRLLYHPFSPYTRKVFVLAHELGLARYIALQKVVVCPIPIQGWSDNNADVAVYNPMAKIPCLVSDDVPDGIFDSRIICEYLNEIASVKINKDARYWQLHTLHAAADGIMDAAVLITYEVRIRKEQGIYFEKWVEGQKQKILRVLDRFEEAAKSGLLPDPGPKPAGADEVAIAVAVVATTQMAYLGIDWSRGREKLVEWMEKWEQRGSLLATPPTRDWEDEAASQPLAKI